MWRIKVFRKDHGEFKSIRIADEFRNMGYGIKLLDHLIIEAKKNGINKISLETGAGNFFEPARKLFEKAGFKIVNHLLIIKLILTLVIIQKKYSLMNKNIDKPYVLYVAEIIYLEIFKNKKKIIINNIEAFERFIGSEKYKK